MASTTPPSIICVVAVTTMSASNFKFHRQNQHHHPSTVLSPLSTTRTTPPRIRAILRIRTRCQITTFAASRQGWHTSNMAVMRLFCRSSVSPDTSSSSASELHQNMESNNENITKVSYFDLLLIYFFPCHSEHHRLMPFLPPPTHSETHLSGPLIWQ